jgi:IS5 family transposase
VSQNSGGDKRPRTITGKAFRPIDPSQKFLPKPRTYRNLARKDYLLIAKQRRHTRNKRRQAIKKQLQYIQRNLAHIEQLIDSGASLEGLTKKQYKTLLVLTEVARQQQWLFDNNKQSIEDRIVSLSQPHIRPIVRGQAGKRVEFGAKLSASCFEGYVFLDRMSWDNFNESGDLKAQVEAYHKFTGYYPESRSCRSHLPYKRKPSVVQRKRN